MNTPTPETDAVWDKKENILDHARKLERERDEFRDKFFSRPAVIAINRELAEAVRERNQLRKVADEWNRIWEKMNDVRSDCVNRDGSFSFANGSKLHRELSAVCAMTNQLPHVIERNK